MSVRRGDEHDELELARLRLERLDDRSVVQHVPGHRLEGEVCGLAGAPCRSPERLDRQLPVHRLLEVGASERGRDGLDVLEVQLAGGAVELLALLDPARHDLLLHVGLDLPVPLLLLGRALCNATQEGLQNTGAGGEIGAGRGSRCGGRRGRGGRAHGPESAAAVNRGSVCAQSAPCHPNRRPPCCSGAAAPCPPRQPAGDGRRDSPRRQRECPRRRHTPQGPHPRRAPTSR